MKEGYILIDGKPTFVKVLKEYTCHGAVVTRHVTDGKTIWETHESLMPDPYCFYYNFVPQ